MFNLPASYTVFVGRAGELVELQQALDHFRLVTLTGPGGCGKTRLALETARQLERRARHAVSAQLPARFQDGVTWCALATVSESAYVSARLLTALGLTERAEISATDIITETLAAHDHLIILDNCEHLVAACAALSETILAKCPRVTLLATSIQPLALAQEKIYPVQPLAVPKLPATMNDAAVLESLSRSDAVQLFVHRAREVFPGFELNLQNAAHIVTICRRLDGLPLAIELAAARVKMLSPAQIVERLDDTFGLLTRGSASALPKHQTLRATLEWSHRLLSEPEQALLHRLSIFAGSFDVEMVEAVCSNVEREASSVKCHPSSVTRHSSSLDLLSDLADKSFLTILREDAEIVRYRLLETIRQYAREQLDAAGEYETFAARHLDWCVSLAERLEPELKGATMAESLARLELEHDNLRAALHFALTAAPERGLRLANALERFWDVRGHATEGRSWLRQLLAASDKPHPADKLNLRENVAVSVAVRARGLFVQGIIAYRQNEYDEAQTCLEKCLHLREELGDQAGIAFALNSLGNVALDRGEFARATELYQESLRRRRELGDARGIASTLNNLGNTAADLGDYDRAAALYAESLALYRQIGDEWSIASSINNLGEVAKLQKDFDRAEKLLSETLARRRALGDQRGVAMALGNLGEVAFAQKEWQQAQALLRESLMLYQSVNNKEGIAHCFGSLAFVEHAQGRAVRAARLLGLSQALRESIRAPLTPADQTAYDGVAAELCAQLNERGFAAAWQAGRAMPLADAIAYALSEPTDVSAPEFELRITAFGTSSVQRNGVLLNETDWKYAKARELFFFLLTQPHASKAELGLALWADISPAQLRARLHRVLHHARRALGANEWILFENDDYAFNRARPYWFDVEQFEQRVRGAQEAAAISQTGEAIRLLQEALPLYINDFLPEFDSEWVVFRREELRQQALDAFMQLGQLLLEQARNAEAVQVYQRILALDNYLEVAHRELMRAYARLGDAARARRHFRQLRDLLREELRTEPSPETVRLDERIKRGEEV